VPVFVAWRSSLLPLLLLLLFRLLLLLFRLLLLLLQLQRQGRYDADTHTYSAVKGSHIDTNGQVSGSSSVSNMVEIMENRRQGDKTGAAAAAAQL
jgi:hypothetical protein